MRNTFMHLVRLFAAVTFVAIVSACATGANFPAQRSEEFVLGRTTKQEVIDVFGKPQKEEVLTRREDIAGTTLPTSVVLSTLYYQYTEPPGDQAVAPGFRPARRALFYFQGGKLVGYFRSSNFKADSTRFDVEKSSTFQKGKTTEKDVVSILGLPSGRGIYPLAADRDGRALFYDFVLPGHPPGSTTTEQARVYISADGVVQDFNVNSSSAANPVAPAPTIIPIYLPRR